MIASCQRQIRTIPRLGLRPCNTTFISFFWTRNFIETVKFFCLSPKKNEHQRRYQYASASSLRQKRKTKDIPLWVDPEDPRIRVKTLKEINEAQKIVKQAEKPTDNKASEQVPVAPVEKPPAKKPRPPPPVKKKKTYLLLLYSQKAFIFLRTAPAGYLSFYLP